jgi:hypothetical protein
MTEVVAKPSKLDASYMLVLDTQGRLTLLKMLSHHPGQVTNACPRKIPSAELSAQMDQRTKAMLKPIVRCAGKHIVRNS